MTTVGNDSLDLLDIAIDDWLDLLRDPSATIARDLLIRALAEDPFATTDLDDCLPGEGITPAAFSRFERASAAYIAACHSEEQDDDQQEILRLTALYRLRRSGAFWLG